MGEINPAKSSAGGRLAPARPVDAAARPTPSAPAAPAPRARVGAGAAGGPPGRQRPTSSVAIHEALVHAASMQQAVAAAGMREQSESARRALWGQQMASVSSTATQVVKDLAERAKESVRAQGEAFMKAP